MFNFALCVEVTSETEANHIKIAWYFHGMIIGKPDYQIDRHPNVTNDCGRQQALRIQ